LITWVIFFEEYRSLSCSLFSLFHSPVTSTLLGPNPLQRPILEHLQPTFLRQCVRPSFTPIQNNRQNYSSVYLNLFCFWIANRKNCCLQLEDGGSMLLQNTGICLFPATLCHFSDDCNLYKSVSEVFLRVMRSFYSRNILMQNTDIFNSYDGRLKATYFVVILLNGKDWFWMLFCTGNFYYVQQ
jgi:hypothetical protein